jgi:hypothetical protein
LEGEGVAVVWDLAIGHGNDFFPMPWSDGWLGEGFNQWDDFNHVIDFCLQFLESIVLLGSGWKLGAIFLEGFNCLSHVLDLLQDFSPGNILPLE